MAVWSLVSDDFCGVLAVTPPLAEGTAHMVVTDNDVFLTGPGANAARIRAEGTVTNVETGEELHYLAIFHSVIPPRGSPADARVLLSEIKLQ